MRIAPAAPSLEPVPNRASSSKDENNNGIRGGVFNEVWLENDIENLIVCLKKWKKNYDEVISEYGQYALCPPPPKGHGCGIEASGFDEITKIFGYRGKRVQSLCRKCRSGHSSDRRN